MHNYAIHCLLWMTRLGEEGKLSIDPTFPKVFYLDTEASSYFTLGRDVEGNPFIGVPQKLCPFFTQIDWLGVTIYPDAGYVFLEARDVQTHVLHMALGIKVRRKRLSALHVEGREDISKQRCNIRVFQQDPNSPDDFLCADQNEISNLSMRVIKSIDDMGSEMEMQDARDMLDQLGIDSSFTPIKVTT